MGFAFLAVSMVEPLVPLYGLFLGASPALVGIIVSAAYLFPSLLAVPLGSMTDRWGPRQVTILGAALFLAGPLIVVLLPGLPTLVVARDPRRNRPSGHDGGRGDDGGPVGSPRAPRSVFRLVHHRHIRGPAGRASSCRLPDRLGRPRWAFGVTALVSVIPAALAWHLERHRAAAKSPPGQEGAVFVRPGGAGEPMGHFTQSGVSSGGVRQRQRPGGHGGAAGVPARVLGRAGLLRQLHRPRL